MVAKMGGLKKAKQIEAALFSLWCHPRRRRLKNRRRWFQVCAEWKIRLSLSSPPPREEDARIDDDGSRARESMTMAVYYASCGAQEFMLEV